MLAWFTETGFGYLLGVVAVTLVGLALVYRGLWGDRSKGRVRCPKCWYDMRGTLPRLECPECGHDAGHQRRLYRTRRGRRRIVVGLVLVLQSAYPLVIVGGYWREQTVVRKYGLPFSPVDRALESVPLFFGDDIPSFGPAWLVDRLPVELARFFDWCNVLRVRDPAQLAACPSLRHLRGINADRQPVTDAGLMHLKGLSKLEILYLKNTQVTDAGLVHLKGLSKLKLLDLSATQITDAGLVHLKGLSKLWFLNLADTAVTDAGLKHLKGLSNLRNLILYDTQVTDAGLVHLKRLSKLKRLGLENTQVTDAGWVRLRETVPNVRIIRRSP
jgi:hypothetical protein